MCFDLDSAPPIPPLSGAAVSHDDLVLEARGREPLRGVPRDARGARARRRRDPPGRPRPLPLLRGARAALRGARVRRRRVRLLRAHGRRREARRRLRVHAARAADDTGRRSGGRRRVRRAPSRRGVRRRLHGRVLLRRTQLVACRRSRSRPRRRDRLLRPTRRRATTAHRGRFSAPPSSPRRSSRSRAATTPGSPARTREAFDEALAAAGVEHEVVIYDGAPHSFFDRKHEEFAARLRGRLEARPRVLERYA